MDFKEYNSIENSYRKKFLDKIVEEGHSKEEFVVQEKIHGANFSFWMDIGGTNAAKRTSFLGEDENFYNSQGVVEKYLDNMRSLFDLLKVAEDAEEVVVYGELYGGSYPHPDVPKSNVKCVQKHVYYSPDQDFIAFDLRVDDRYVDVEIANALFERAGIPYVKTLFKGSLEDCLNYNNNYQTTIPKEKGFPEIEGNICEGNVIRPVRPIFLWSGERLILKNKNESFKEKHGVNKNKSAKPKEVKQLRPETQKAIETVQQYITENRLRNVLSKVGEVGQKDFGKVMSLFTKDIIEDFRKDEEEVLESLEKEERKLVTKAVGQNAAQLLRKNFLNIVDGEF